MNLKRAYYAASFSLLLPGLGQLYLGRWARAACLFAAFALLLLMPFGRWLIFLLAPYAAWEAHRAAIRLEPLPETAAKGILSRERAFLSLGRDKYRLPAFIGVGVLGFSAWFIGLFPFMSPVAFQAELNEEAFRLGSCLKARGTLNVADCVPPGDADLARDPWGGRYTAEEAEGRVLLRSAGPDGEVGTRDDFVYRFR